MKVENNKYVSLTYKLYVTGKGENEETLMEETTSGKPLSFITGAGLMLESFENNLRDLSNGDKFDFILKSDEAYGVYHDDRVIDLPKSSFEVDGKIDENMIFVNNTIPMVDKNGNRFEGSIVEIADKTIKMDFNHPLAGEDLHFTGEILDVHEPTEKEKEKMLSGKCGGCHGDDGCECGENGCGCDSHDEGCGCGEK